MWYKAAILVGLGGAFGSIGRWGLSLLLGNSKWLVLGTLLANFLAAFVLGAFSARNAMLPMSASYRLLIAVGFCGGLSTFSTFSFESFKLLQEGAVVAFVLHTVLHVLVSLGAVALGWYIFSGLEI